MSLSELRNAIGKTCPADLRRVSLINANDRCDPNGSVRKACDNLKSVGDQTRCYEDIFACRRQVDEENQTVYDYNDWIAKCTAAEARRQGPPPDTTVKNIPSSDDFASRLDKAKIRNQQMDDVNGKQQKAFDDEVGRRLSANYESYIRKLEEERREEARLREL